MWCGQSFNQPNVSNDIDYDSLRTFIIETVHCENQNSRILKHEELMLSINIRKK